MKTLRHFALLGLTAILLVTTARAEKEDATQKDLARLQGAWSMVSGISDGQTIPESVRQQMKRVCKKDEATTTMGGRVLIQAKITLDASKNPKTIDFHMTGGLTQGKTQLGIYEVDGDTLKSCISAPGDPRPADFSSKPGDHRTSTVWKRAKATATTDQK